ncbi:hypothetical protein MZM54_07250 [[Brevibacterium] frigoritolerans]|nr:hypothetical protein [Peribacillus frigoritolerans]
MSILCFRWFAFKAEAALFKDKHHYENKVGKQLLLELRTIIGVSIFLK